jgi:3-oxoadipate enol-lactonase
MVLAHDLDGTGDPVVLLHSGVADRRMWQPQCGPLLEAGYQVVRPDFRGHGGSPMPTAPYNDADDVRELLDSLGIGRINLVGSSFGGRIAQQFAARWPDRVSALALLCPAADVREKTAAVAAFGQREQELIEAGDLDGAVALNVDTFVGPAASQSTRDLVAQMQRLAFEVQLAAPEVEEVSAEFHLKDISARTLVVAGLLDLDFFIGTASDLAAIIPNAHLVELDWAGHLPSLEDPDRFNPVLLDFLTGSQAPAPS